MLAILKSDKSGTAYEEAAKCFQSMYKKVTGVELDVIEQDDNVSDLIVIGSDAVNDFLMREVLELRLGSLGIRYGTDDYCIQSYRKEDRKVLILAGGRGRSTLYAVYDYFERYLNCHYFWDGDIIPYSNTIPMENISVRESPRFEYRGLRYFAHRGLKRFQAEHWSFEDWKQEIDWLIKKRLNFFMLRIGMDDVWQRAFPEVVSYPESFQTIEGIDANGYDDRSDIWTLKYRGQLREKILTYARDRDLMYPVDCGTMTHWYSRTPQEFLEKQTPPFVTQEQAQYTASDTGKVFDFTQKEVMEYYMQLTNTMVNEYEKSTGLFHTIGLGERLMYKDRAKNFALKLIAYRRIAENIRQKYPDSKLMLASWDFIGWWSCEEVQNLVKELDPERTIIMDYTSEVNDPEDYFMNWGVVGKFPWIFGLFHAYESESELRGPYDRSDERLKIAAADPYCKGMILWPELSHSDPLILEYLAQNAWSPLEMSLEELTERFCRNRYGVFAEKMNECWQTFLPFIKLGDWGSFSRRTPEDEKYEECCKSWYAHQDLWTELCFFLDEDAQKDQCLQKYYTLKMAETVPLLPDIAMALKKISEQKDMFEESFVLRDAVDLTRTVLGRIMNFLIMQGLKYKGNKAHVQILKQKYLEFMDIMAQLLSLSSDFSMYESLKSLQKVAPVNPNFELTLKRNISNEYCTQPAYELITQVFIEEGIAVFDWMGEVENSRKPDFAQLRREIMDRFMNTSLESMQAKDVPKPEEIIRKAAYAIEHLSEV